jgi:flavin-dependent dehydrogenase
MIKRFDVAIVGAGPAGSACALRLARKGARVALIDSHPFPRAKSCGEYLNLGAIRELYKLGLGDELARKAARLEGMRLFVHDELASFPISPPAWSIARTKLDTTLRTAALAAGAEPALGRLQGLEVHGDGVMLRLSERDGGSFLIDARYVVGADGMRSTVARLCGLTKRVQNGFFAIVGHHPNMAMGRWIEIYTAASGYLAFNPLDTQSANVVFVLHRSDLARAGGAMQSALRRFSERVTHGRRVVDDEQFHAQRRAIGPLAHRAVRPVYERVLLIGDAAAFVDPFTGQGVYLALAEARLAAQAIAESLDDPHREHDAWREYAHAVRGVVGERDRVALMMKTFVHFGAVARRAARCLRRRPEDFSFLIEAVCAKRSARPLELAGALGQALRGFQWSILSSSALLRD